MNGCESFCCWQAASSNCALKRSNSSKKYNSILRQKTLSIALLLGILDTEQLVKIGISRLLKTFKLLPFDCINGHFLLNLRRFREIFNNKHTNNGQNAKDLCASQLSYN